MSASPRWGCHPEMQVISMASMSATAAPIHLEAGSGVAGYQAGMPPPIRMSDGFILLGGSASPVRLPAAPGHGGCHLQCHG